MPFCRMSSISESISRISRRCASLIATASSHTRTSWIPARSDRVIAIEWCGIIALMKALSSTVAWLRSKNADAEQQDARDDDDGVGCLVLVHVQHPASMTRPMLPPAALGFPGGSSDKHLPDGALRARRTYIPGMG